MRALFALAMLLSLGCASSQKAHHAQASGIDAESGAAAACSCGKGGECSCPMDGEGCSCSHD